MKRRGDMKIIFTGMLLWLALFVTACDQTPPQQQAATQTKAIKIQNSSTAAVEQQPAAEAPVQKKAPSNGENINAVAKQEETVSELVQESLEIATVYDATGRFDPFEPLFKDEPEIEVTETDKVEQKKKRKPQTPLERIALSQLKLSAIIRAPSGNRALVEDATGKGYVVRKGTYMGLNSGKVIQIENDKIIVEEEIESVLGDLRLKNTELKLQKPPGEL